MTLRLVFMGTPEFSVPTLEALTEAGHEIAAVYTQPPRPAGRRGLEFTKSPVHLAAERLGFVVRTPSSLKDEDAQASLRSLAADAVVVVAYGLLLPKPILEATRLGAYNGHASLLPRWRGAAPIQRAIMAGDTETGMTIMKMDEGLDTGPIALMERVAINGQMSAGELHDRLKTVGASLMVEAFGRLEDGMLAFRPQPPEGATYARKISKEEIRIDWTRSARVVHDHIRGLSPAPGAWTMMPTGSGDGRVKLLRSARVTGHGRPGEILGDGLTIACDDNAVRILEVQKAGGRAMTADDFLAGARLQAGTVLV